ncbi:MAG: efflux RND transporter permease subunit [Bacteroidia bacterium]|nr:efflux RND transporter permease subunit [Bacteroidia bacterium]
MNISITSINRPVFATVVSILILLFGGIGYYYLGVREFPSVDPPVITVSTNYTGANAEVIESQITEPLEENINGIAGIRSITSTSSDGRSNISVEFELDRDLEAAANDVRDKVSGAIRQLPVDCDPPTVVKSDANASAIASILITSDKRSLLELSKIANDLFKENFQTIPGVSQVQIWGERKYAMKLYMDPQKLAAYGLTPLDVRNALLAQNVETPAGRIEGLANELTIRTLGRLSTADEFDNIVLLQRSGLTVKFKDVGYAEMAAQNERTILRGNGVVPMIGVGVTPQPGANYISIANELYKRLEIIKKDLPADINAELGIDFTLGIRRAITEVVETIAIAFLLVMMVIFIFLREWRTTLIPIVAIPVSLIGSFFIMYLAGFSINILTLLGIVLATGLVVDDAIVVLENIYTKIEDGMAPMQAGYQGSKEITFAIISTTITLAAVFLPVIFLQGLTGRLFREFGVVVAGSVLISAIVSLTLTPMMSARFLKHQKHSTFYTRTEKYFERLLSSYQNALHRFLNRKKAAWLILALSAVLIGWLGVILPSELAPLEDKGRFQIAATAPEGVSFEKMDEYMKTIAHLADTLPEKRVLIEVTSPGFGSSVSVNSGFMRVVLVDADKRNRSQQQLVDVMNAEVRKYNFARAFVIQDQTIGGGRFNTLPVQYVIQTQDFEKLKKELPAFMEAVQNSKVFTQSDLNLKFNKPELTVQVNRERATALGINVKDIAETMQFYFSGQRYGYFIMDGKQYQVIGQATRDNRNKPLDLTSIFVRNQAGTLVQLDNVVDVSYSTSPPQLYRYNRYASATISAQPAANISLGQGIAEMDRIKKQVLDDSFTSSLTGVSKEFAESSNTLLFAFLLALLLIYLILAAQFESFVDPLIIMFTVPLALAGALLSLWMFNQTLNIFSEIGIIVLIGIVTKNGILIVEFANQRKAGGLNRLEAATEAALQRFRPILMTSLATMLGALPIALALGASAQSRVSMGIAIIGGLLFSLILTLFVIPALYALMSRNANKPATV